MSRPRYTLKSSAQFRWFMGNPWTGIPFKVRPLADAVGVSPGMIQKLADGKQDNVDVLVAHSLVEAFGCSILNLFAPPATQKSVNTTPNDSPEKE